VDSTLHPTRSELSCLPRCVHLQEGDTVVIGESDFEWSDDQSEGAMYDSWEADMRSRGQARQGAAKWPRGPPLKKA
jgi:hypothetical protein